MTQKLIDTLERDIRKREIELEKAARKLLPRKLRRKKNEAHIRNPRRAAPAADS
jgi:hypothetical protein